VLLVGHSADFSKYSLLGLLVDTSSGTYDVYIDDVLVGSGVTSNTQYDIDFSTIATNYGTATTPEALVLHKVVIKPNTSGATISAFKFRKNTNETASTEYLGILWVHYELNNTINLSELFNSGNNYRSAIVQAITAQNDILNTSNIGSAFRASVSIKYIPKIETDSLYVYNSGGQSGLSQLKRLIIKVNNDISGVTDYFLVSTSRLEQICLNKKLRIQGATISAIHELKMLPQIYKPTSTDIIIPEGNSLYPTKLDFGDIVNMTRCKPFGTSAYPMRGLRGLKVSNEAPFSGASPQIDVSYTGLDRDALVELFNSLPAFMPLTKEGSPTISSGVVSGFSDSDYLSSDISISEETDVEYKFKFTTGSDITTGQYIFAYQAYTTAYRNCGIFINGNRYGVVLREANDSSQQYIGGYVNPNTTYYLKMIFTKSNKLLKVGISTDDITYSCDIEKTLSSNLAPINRKTYVGRAQPSNYYWLGSIDIPNCYMKLDGTKYQFRLPSGTETTATSPTLKCVGATGTPDLTEEDKNIALNKNWQLTLS
jgi:hypothetical protein